MSEFTKGPWVVSDSYGPNENGTCVQSVHDIFMVASCTGYYGRPGAVANARLIASAPELLECLQEMLEVNPDEKDGIPYWEACDKAMKVIKKAVRHD